MHETPSPNNPMSAVEALPQRPPRVRKRQKLEQSELIENCATSEVPKNENRKKTTQPGTELQDRTTEGGAEEPSSSHPDAPPGARYEYMDHTADIQLHSWGNTLKEALEQVGLCMYNYMTPLTGMGEALDSPPRKFQATGHDLHSLLFSFLDELLFVFNTEFFVCQTLSITSLDLEGFTLEAEGRGDTFDRARHAAGTEIKAITYSAMEVVQNAERTDVYVIVDI
uniref:Archease domain-containing protein n=1 Tax=Auxenochlorella protothecoides TaxID=3075 RepID=A0A1D2AFN4_AUXPR